MKKLTSVDGYSIGEMIAVVTQGDYKATECLLAGVIASEIGKQLDAQDMSQMFYALDEAGIYGSDITKLYEATGSSMAFMGLIGMIVVEKMPPEVIKTILEGVLGGHKLKAVIKANIDDHCAEDGDRTCH